MATSANNQHRQGADFQPRHSGSQAEGKCLKDTVHRLVKYLNNIVETDHDKRKRLINPLRELKFIKTANAPIHLCNCNN